MRRSGVLAVSSVCLLALGALSFVATRAALTSSSPTLSVSSSSTLTQTPASPISPTPTPDQATPDPSCHKQVIEPTEPAGDYDNYPNLEYVESPSATSWGTTIAAHKIIVVRSTSDGKQLIVAFTISAAGDLSNADIDALPGKTMTISGKSYVVTSVDDSSLQTYNGQIAAAATRDGSRVLTPCPDPELSSYGSGMGSTVLLSYLSAKS
jgi:hypothetical protein